MGIERANILRRFLWAPFDTPRATEFPRGHLKAGKLSKVVYGVEIVDGLLGEISNYETKGGALGVAKATDREIKNALRCHFLLPRPERFTYTE